MIVVGYFFLTLKMNNYNTLENKKMITEIVNKINGNQFDIEKISTKNLDEILESVENKDFLEEEDFLILNGKSKVRFQENLFLQNLITVKKDKEDIAKSLPYMLLINLLNCFACPIYFNLRYGRRWREQLKEKKEKIKILDVKLKKIEDYYLKTWDSFVTSKEDVVNVKDLYKAKYLDGLNNELKRYLIEGAIDKVIPSDFYICKDIYKNVSTNFYFNDNFGKDVEDRLSKIK